MRDLVKTIEELKTSEISETINTRIKEFSEFKTKSISNIFKEMCFCIMTANCAADKCIEIHSKMENDFLSLDQNQLAINFKEHGYRFPNVRSKYIFEARTYLKELENELKNSNANNSLREWIVKNIKGLGYKEASHFLRNIGFEDYAIIDFHIIDVLVKFKLIEKPKTLTSKKYLEIENVLRDLARKLDLNLAQLDLYLWFLETGKVLK